MNGGGCGAVSSAAAFAYFVVLVVLRRGVLGEASVQETL